VFFWGGKNDKNVPEMYFLGKNDQNVTEINQCSALLGKMFASANLFLKVIEDLTVMLSKCMYLFGKFFKPFIVLKYTQ
jgi:hypothetical protein